MIISFNINYQTIPGQRMCVLGSISELGAGQVFMAKEMIWIGNGNWTLDVDISLAIEVFDYQYVLIEPNGDRILEPWGRKRHLKLEINSSAIYHLYDYWRLEPIDTYFYTSAFTKSLFARESGEIKADFEGKLVIRVFCPHIEKQQKLFVIGNQPCLGLWNPDECKMLNGLNFPEWEICLNANEITFPLEYKFFVCDSEKQAVHWESGENRLISDALLDEYSTTVVHDYPYRDVQPKWKGAGTVIPVFSLRSAKSYGIGDFHDLRLLIDWAGLTNQRLIQILPMNDTTRTHTWADSYPYSAISIYALHPMYISLSDLKPLNDTEKEIYFEEKRIIINREEFVDYDVVVKYKMQYLHDYFEQEKEHVVKSELFNAFLQENQLWLMPYAVFCYFRDKYQTADFLSWENDASYNPVRVQDLCDIHSEAYQDILFTYFLQFILHTQFKSVSDYARQKGIVLKGDLPIGVNRTSVEAWTERAYFNMAGQAGAPPDDFSDIGQNWSFPTYNWDIMEKDGYTWWKKRFHMLSDYYDCFRIDHILGFFRIWEIPIDYIQGLCGHFRPALPFSVSEIEEYGIRFDDRYIQPRIHCRFLIDIFGEYTDRVVGTYLSFADAEHLILSPFCDTQRKIEQLFNEETDEAFIKIKNGLLSIANEVLFLEDPYEPLKYHPRISAAHSFVYKELTINEQNAFDRLANDFFYVRHNEFWKTEALKRLTSLIFSTDMLICGEDLGMIPKSVHEVMNQLHILSLELERAPKIEGIRFTDLNTIPYLSVCTTSTHDMSPLRNWWKEDYSRTQMYYYSVLHREGEAPEECSSELAKQIISDHLHATSMLTIIPLQDWLAISDTLKRADIEHERINVPANPQHYWCYRMHISLEELLSAYDLNQEIKEMLIESNR
jgi:4-alpha-glucanotransferase